MFILIMWTPLSIFCPCHDIFKFAVQEVFKCHKATNSGDHIGLLFLSRHLKKYRYGLEYASLEVKNHLEQVNFSDLVETIMIMLVHLNIVFPVI